MHGMMMYSLTLFCKLNFYWGVEVVILPEITERGGVWKGWTAI